MSRVDASIDRYFRENSARAVASIAKAFGDIELAEEAVQEAYLRLLTFSERNPLPDNLNAWIVRVARNWAIDRFRHSRVQDDASERLAREAAPVEFVSDDESLPDDRLELIFACAHPALQIESQVALTLRFVCGLTTKQIASAFFTPEATMTRRLTRAKQKIRDARIAFEIPPPHRLKERLESVLAVIYLIFNEGYKASSGEELVDVDLCRQGVWLAGLVHQLAPEEPDALGLYCLLLFQHSRYRARTDRDGMLQTLDVQDRTRWDHHAIERAVMLFSSRGDLPPTPYVIEAEIAAHHATAARFEDTDWPRIAALYEVLAMLKPSPIVMLNRAVAIGMAFGFERGLAALDAVASEGQLQDHYLLHASRADFLKKLDRTYEAAVAYRQALTLAPTEAERRFLRHRLRCLQEQA